MENIYLCMYVCVYEAQRIIVKYNMQLGSLKTCRTSNTMVIKIHLSMRGRKSATTTTATISAILTTNNICLDVLMQVRLCVYSNEYVRVPVHIQLNRRQLSMRKPKQNKTVYYNSSHSSKVAENNKN